MHTLRELGPTDRMFVAAPSRWRQFRLLWRGGKEVGRKFEELAAELPEKTREVWNQCRLQHTACLRAVEQTTLRKIRAFPLFLEQARLQEISLSDGVLQAFVRDAPRCFR